MNISFQAIIIDDEPKLREVLKIKLSEYCTDIEIVGMASNVNEAYILIKEHKPNLIFLDISMPGGSGFDLLNRFEKIDFEIIFVTGFDEYALDALKLSAVDYLLKPVDSDSLVIAVEKAKSNIINGQKVQRYDVLKHNNDPTNSTDIKISIPGINSFEFLKISEIIRCEGWQKYTKIYLDNGECIVSSYNIGIYKNMLEKYGFFSSHKSHIINSDKIKKYLKEGTIILNDGSEVPVARRKKEEFIETILSPLSNKII